MSRQTIPEKTIIYCDACGIETNQASGKGRRRMEMVLSVRAHALDMRGDPAANGSFSRELCDECGTTALQALRDALGSDHDAARKARETAKEPS